MFGKKDKPSSHGLPDLPRNMAELPSIRDYQRSNFMKSDEDDEDDFGEIHGLPSFPDSPMKKGFSQSAIKDAIETSDHEDSDLPPLPENRDIPSSRKMEMEEWTPPIIHQPMQRQMIDNNKPIFVKLDKFKEAKESLDKISEKLGEVDELLKLIKDVKDKEAREVGEWEREIEKIKSRIVMINSDIFENAY